MFTVCMAVFVASVLFCMLGQAEAKNLSLLGCYTVPMSKSLQRLEDHNVIILGVKGRSGFIFSVMPLRRVGSN